MTTERFEITLSDDGRIHISGSNGRRASLITPDGIIGYVTHGAIRQQARDIEQLRADLAAAVARAEQADQRLGNLLALILRDGGHYQSERGTENAMDAAQAALMVWRQVFDESASLRQRAEQAEARLAAIDAAPVVHCAWVVINGVNTYAQLIARPEKD